MHCALILRILLLAVFLNTVIGQPLHASMHGETSGASAAHAAAGEDPASCGPDDEAQAHAACAWCLAHAGQTSAPPPATIALPWPPMPAHGLMPGRDIALPACADVWAARPRGPPR